MVAFCSDVLRRVLNSCIQDVDIDEFAIQLQRVYRDLVALELYGELTDSEQRALEWVKDAVDLLEEMSEEHTTPRYQAPVEYRGAFGRPRFEIPRHQLVSLIEMRFVVPAIAEMIGVSVRTIRRRMEEYGISVKSQYSQVTDEQLDDIVWEIQEQFPSCGNRQMLGHLQSRGIREQQHRVWESQRRVDPFGSVMRRLRSIHRRRYHVSGPGALWHIDGHHKLIR